MIVCHCQGITDREIREAVRKGARSCHQVVRECRAGGACGGCTPLIRELIECQTKVERARPLFAGHEFAATA